MKERRLETFLQILFLFILISSCFTKYISKRNDILNHVVSSLSDDDISEIDILSRKSGISLY
jgi:hypothetical protein